MGEGTKIEWADHTFNPWIGCTKVSAGCANCYAEDMMDRRYGRVAWGAGNPRQRTSKSNWKKPLAWDAKAAAACLEGSERPRVFCSSLADVFDPDVPIEWLADLFDVIHRTPNLVWMLLTKRPHLILSRIGKVVGLSCVTGCTDEDEHGMAGWMANRWQHGNPPENVWLGTSVENQAAADERIPQLLKIPAAKRFLSCEPLLGPVDLQLKLTATAADGDMPPGPKGPPMRIDALTGLKWSPAHRMRGQTDAVDSLGYGIDWVIAGGESGPHARPMHPDWARSLRDQCSGAGVPFFFKQWGEWAPGEEVEANGTGWLHMYENQDDGGAPVHHWPDADIRAAARRRGRDVPAHTQLVGDTEVLRVGKKRAGRLLDGRVWDEVPA